MMHRKINKILILIYSYINLFLIHDKIKKHEHEYNNRMLIIAVGPLGDSLMFMDAFRELVSFYKNLNYIVTLVCLKDTQKLFENIVADKNFNIINVETKGSQWTDFNEFRRIIKKIQRFHYKKSINVSVARLGDMFAACTYSKEYIRMDYKFCIRQKSIKYLIDSLYTDIIECPDISFMGKCYSTLLRRLGDIKYLSGKPQINLKKRVVHEKYIIVAPLARTSYRNLSIVQTISIIQYLLKTTDSYIYVTGNQSDDDCISCIMSKCRHNRVINMSGKTDFNEFLYLVDGAQFLIGTDSGHIHIAAAVNTPSIALVGKHTLGMFLPYNYDKTEENEPICVYSRKEYPCQNCIKTYQRQKVNSECYKRIKQGKNCLCLEEIDIQDVYHVIDSVLNT